MGDSKTTRDQALRVARMLGCQGVYEDGKGWMPCASREEYEAIKKGTEEYLKVRASKNKKPLPKMVQRTKRLETKSDAYYENRADAVAISKARGCGGVRTVLLAGKKYYAVCNHKAPKRGWENLDEKPISGIATLPGGGLVTGSFSGKSLGRPIGGVADFDGDGDNMVTGPDGVDNIPAPVRMIELDQLNQEALRKHRNFIDYNGWEFAQKEWNRIYSIAKRKKMQSDSEIGSIGDVILAMTPAQREAEIRLRRRPYNENDWKENASRAFSKKHGVIWDVLEQLHSREPELGKVPKNAARKSEPPPITEEKGFVNFVSRSTDPDTFSDPESARIRARNIGCIGIRRYTARDGKLVWMPCTNVSDYNRATGIRGDNSPRRQGSKFGKKSLGKPIGGRSNEDGDGDGFTTGGIIGGEDKIPVAKLPDVLTTDALKKMRSDVNPDFLDPKKSSGRHGDEEFSAAELMKLPAENAYNLSLLNSESAEYLENQRKKNSGGMNQRIRQEGVFYPIILREWADGKRSIYDGHHRLIAAYDNHPDFRVPVFVWKEEGKLEDENKSVGQKGFVGEGILSFKGVPKPKKKPPTVNSGDINDLAVRVRNNNAKAKTTAKTNLRDLKIVFMRGLADGSKEIAKKRVYKFLALLNSDKPADVKYFEDNDLLPLDHPWRNRKTSKKWAGFQEGEYGVKYSKGCCPRVVKRHYSNSLTF